MFSSIVNYGIGHAGGRLATWKYMYAFLLTLENLAHTPLQLLRYLFAGSLTILWAFVVLLFIPISPRQPGRWFTADEKVMLEQRLVSNMTGKDQTGWKRDQFAEAIMDPKLWILMLCGAATYVCNGGVTAVCPFRIVMDAPLSIFVNGSSDLSSSNPSDTALSPQSSFRSPVPPIPFLDRFRTPTD